MVQLKKSQEEKNQKI